MNIPADLGQRILDLARIAAALHAEQLPGTAQRLRTAGGAGPVVDHDGRSSTDGTAPLPARVR